MELAISLLAFGAGFASSTVSYIFDTCHILACGAWLLPRGLDFMLNGTAANCIVDLTEGKDTTIALQQCIAILCLSPYDQMPLSPLISRLMGGLRHAVQTVSIAKPDCVHGVDMVYEPWKEVFWSEVQTVARALLGEKDLEDAKFTMVQWLDLRVVTISGNPHVFLSVLLLFLLLSMMFSSHSLQCTPPSPSLFSISSQANTYILSTARPLLVLLGASCGLSVTSDTLTASPLVNLPLILGLQNDILGFDRDHAGENPLSAVQLLIRDGWTKKKALMQIVDHHNHLVKEMVMARNHFRGSKAEEQFVNMADAWPNAMTEWMLSCERYKLTA